MSSSSNEPAMTRFTAVFTIVPVIWLWWLSILPNETSLTVDNTTWNYHYHYYDASDWKTWAATVLLIAMFAWVLELLYVMKARSEHISTTVVFGLFFHTVPAVCLVAAVLKSRVAKDGQLVWFSALMAFRYWRTLIAIFFWPRYRIAGKLADGEQEVYKPSDCTVVVATVGPGKNVELFTRMVEAILANKPRRVVFSTPKPAIADTVRRLVSKIQSDFEARKTETETKMRPDFLQATLPAFRDEHVGFVGTRKWVERLPLPEHDPKLNQLQNFMARYRAGFWNTIGALYLIRHNFEIRASNAADGGIFCVSGRTSLILSKIVKDDAFIDKFLNEYIWAFPSLGVEGVGPLKADDDNFITRWVIKHGMDVKIQYSEDATMTTQLGRIDQFKFVDQCIRWSRTTIRQNPVALFVDQTIWWKWPISVWMVYLPWMYNAALFWDSLAVWTFTTTAFFRESPVQYRWLTLLFFIIWMSKLTKTAAWFIRRKNWSDFFWYFFPIPAYPLFAYGHSLVKVYTVLTFWGNDWDSQPKDEDHKLK